MNQSVFLKSVAPFQDKIFRFAKRLLISTEEAQDALQEVLLKLWQQHQNQHGIKNLEAFAMTLTKNWCFDKLKAKSTDNLSLSHFQYDAKSENSLQKQVETNDMVNLVKQLIDQLPEQQRMIIQLRDIEQYEFEEIEEITGIKQATLRVILSRARKSIREQMVGCYKG
ncbi:RNA polymerase sigma factor [Capnocytophaga canimorsus]|uniref:RNA polymerase sigma factor n=1 Tax=Capnocytophaga canimorsus TaxID=28188 RepID=UPI001EDDBE3E|nr:sigma-70 family RNA polymerase sigma factor [Capnocytophaga canimorsus]GJQ03635.1 DNA-directed RNA polymerase sigma-70 factor [Capnocytophaga canimorsus]